MPVNKHSDPEELPLTKTQEGARQSSVPDAQSQKQRHIERMLSPTLEREEEREQAYDKLAGWLLSIHTGGHFASDFVHCANQLWRPHTPLNVDEYPSIRLVEKPKELEILEKRYKTTFNRSIVMMDINDYQRFYRNMFNRGGSGGFNMQLPTGANLIVTTPMSDYVYHELRHSIDANQFKRRGDDTVLVEFVGFYGDVINPRVVQQTTTTRDGYGNSVTKTQRNILHTKVGEMGKKLKTDTHHQQCCPHRTFEEYVHIVDRVSGMLDQLSKTYSPEEIERILYHSKTIADIEGML